MVLRRLGDKPSTELMMAWARFTKVILKEFKFDENLILLSPKF